MRCKVNKWLLLAAALCSSVSATATPWNQFGVRMEKELPAEKSSIFSPLSLWLAMAMVEAGSEKQTKTELRNVLGLGSMTSEKVTEQMRAIGTSKFYEIGVANAMFPAAGKPFEAAYTAKIKKDFGADFQPLNYPADPEGSRVTINSWVEKKTGGKIRTLMAKGTVTPATRFVLTNAVYFKGAWDIPFDKYNTKDGSFEGAGKIKFMNKTDYFAYYEDPKVQALRMEYEGDQMYFLILLPRSGKSLAEGGPLRMEALRDRLSNKRVNVVIPKFRVEAEITGLREKLGRMGITRIFDPAKSELGKISKGPLVVSDVIHKAMIEVNEAGTEAAAATAVTALGGAAPAKEVQPVNFVVDHPFRFYIIHRATKTVMFSGQYFGD